MKLNKLLPFFALSLLAISAQAVHASDVGNLTIQIQGIDTDEGQAIFVLMDSKSSHQGKTSEFIKKQVPIKKQSAKLVFTDIPAGDYSAVVYHDINGNGKLDRYFFGKPKEPYGFSNNARNPIGIPDFEDSKFTVGTNESVQNIIVE